MKNFEKNLMKFGEQFSEILGKFYLFFKFYFLFLDVLIFLL